MYLSVLDKHIAHIHEELGEVFRFAHLETGRFAYRICAVTYVV